MHNEPDQRHDSPDGTLRITSDTVWEDRIGERDTVHLIDPRSGALLVELWGIRLEGAPKWSHGGGADFSVNVEGTKCRVRVFPDHTFVLHPTEEPRPLSALPSELWARAPRSTALPPPIPADDKLGWGTILISLLFVAIGTWMIIEPRRGRWDRGWGIVCVVFFGTGVVLGLWEKWRRK